MLFSALSAVTLFVKFFTILPGVASQTTDAVCLPTFNWTSNSLHQSPCLVAAYLMNECVGSYNVAALTPDAHYLGPATLTDPTQTCACSTVTYSLFSACGECQNRTIADWDTWMAQCTTVYIDSYPKPIPPGTAVPGWAYLDVEAEGIFDSSVAQQNANMTESTAAPSPTVTSRPLAVSSTTASVTHLTSSSAPPVASSKTTFSSHASHIHHVHLILETVLGSVLGFTLVASLLYLVFRWRHRMTRTTVEGSSLSSPVMGENIISTLIHSAAPSVNQPGSGSRPSGYTDNNFSGSSGSLEHKSVV